MSDERTDESVEVVRVTPDQAEEPRTGGEEGVYRGYRYRLTALFESYTNDKAAALELTERWERGVNEALHVTAPSSKAIRLGFVTAARSFLEEG